MNFKCKTNLASALCGVMACVAVVYPAMADLLQQDDVIIVGSLCVGVDCVNGENFNYDTIRMKENNTRIKFQDTSSSASFPKIDWQLTANDSQNGGLNYFAIESIDNTKKPFQVTYGADDYSIYVHSNSRIGFNTNTPGVTMQVTTGNSPTLRLDQDGSGGFAAQAWDVGGNETNFFVRDVNNASQLPLRIRVGAPNGSLYVDVDGDIGLGTITPDGIFDLASPADANNHAVLVDAAGNFGINIDNGRSVSKQFEIQSTGGVSEFSVAANGDTTINGKLNVTGDTTITGATNFNNKVYTSTAGYLGINTNDFSTSEGLQPQLKIVAESGIHNILQFESDNATPNYTASIMFTRNNERKWMLSSRNTTEGANDYFYILEKLGNPVLSLFQDGSVGLGRIIDTGTVGSIAHPVVGRAINTGTGAYLSTGGTWTDASSRQFKQNIEVLSTEQAVNALEQLEPVTYQYKTQPDEPYVGFIAEDVPELVAMADRKSLAPMDIVAVLTKVVKEQQATIKAQQKLMDELAKRVDKVEASR